MKTLKKVYVSVDLEYSDGSKEVKVLPIGARLREISTWAQKTPEGVFQFQRYLDVLYSLNIIDIQMLWYCKAMPASSGCLSHRLLRQLKAKFAADYALYCNESEYVDPFGACPD